MIATFLQGGLGNQMFQYAYGRKLALTMGTVLKMDLGYYAEPFYYDDGSAIGHMAYSLDKFGIMQNIISAEELVSMTWNVVDESKNKKERDFFEPNENIFLMGYWQNENYFKGIEDILRTEFLLKEPLSECSKMWKEKIMCEQMPISIHFRRAMLKDEYARNIIGMLPMQYYQTAIDYMLQRFQSIKFFVFSDDMDWVKRHVDFKAPVFWVVGNDEYSSHEDMFLMSKCKHHIIANSTFSWWGAWLNSSNEKIVVCPSHWIRKDIEKNQIVPSSWVAIDNNLDG